MKEINDKQASVVQKFFGSGQFLPVPGREKEEGHNKYLWDDFKAVKALLIRNPGLNIYTVIDEGGKGWIARGCKVANRAAYILSNTKVDIPRYGFRYW